MSQENADRTGWGGTFIRSVLYSSPLTTHTHTLALRDAAGRIQAAQPARASASYTLWITGDLLDNCWLLFSSVHCIVGRGHIMYDLKSKWHVLDIKFWEAVETFYFVVLLTYTLNDVDNYWSYSFSKLFVFILELHIECCELQYTQNPQLEITFRASLKTGDVCKRACLT